LRSVDAVLTKPGYGTFAEAACNGTPLLYLRREDWPEQDFLIDWLQTHGRCREISAGELLAGRLLPSLEALWRQAAPPIPTPSGAEDAAAVLLPWLGMSTRQA
jgi:UDP-N-acetylglucosamine:LPS N-acetylglucosamine transferase